MGESIEPNAFTGATLDRAGDARRRDAEWLARQGAHPRARAVVAGDSGLRVDDGRLARVPLAELSGAPDILLGLDAEGPVFAFDETPPGDGIPPLVGAAGRRGEPPARDGGRGRLGLREAAAVLSQTDGGLAAYAAALLNWHRRHRFCANCGRATDVAEGGLVRTCPHCRAEHHPRTDPVVIMLVTDGERVLLGRQAAWPTGRYSALAGFVEPGESLEEAVRREVREEAGVSVDAPRYVASQPWPFPASLMLGFTAEWTGGEPHVRDEELQDVRWFGRAEVAAAAAEDSDADWGTPGDAGGELKLPPRLAIARRLVEGWLSR